MKKLNFEVGKKYRGYGFINEFGEFEFTPEQTGANKGQVTPLRSTEDYNLSYTKKYVLIHMKLEKRSPIELIKKLMNICSNLISDFKKYEF